MLTHKCMLNQRSHTSKCHDRELEIKCVLTWILTSIFKGLFSVSQCICVQVFFTTICACFTAIRSVFLCVVVVFCPFELHWACSMLHFYTICAYLLCVCQRSLVLCWNTTGLIILCVNLTGLMCQNTGIAHHGQCFQPAVSPKSFSPQDIPVVKDHLAALHSS